MRVTLERDALVVKRALRKPQTVFLDDVEAGADDVASFFGSSCFVKGVHEAITPPAPTDKLDDARAAWTSWLAGPRCARRGAKALLACARALSASDVHIEPTSASSAIIRLRIDGELVELCTATHLDPVIAALKGMACCLAYRRDVVQEGRIAVAEGVAADVRASFVPTALGERVALRLFGRLFSLDELELAPSVHDGVVRALGQRSGLLVVAGATGAGKTTTLYALLAELCRTRGGAHLSLEDPVEQRLRTAGVPVDQVELDPARGITAESMLVAALRQDIDVIAVGEVRTPAEARLALHAAHTGRLVLCGLHASSSSMARQRLLDLGLDARELDASLVAVLHQELPSQSCCEIGCNKCQGRRRRRRLRAELWTAPRGPREVEDAA